MSYLDLPSDLSTRSLTDTTLAADVIDLILEPDERERGCVAAMLCDADDIGVQPLVLGDLGPEGPVTGARRLLDHVLPELAAVGGSVLLGLGRPGGVVLTDGDRAWHQSVLDLCRAHDVRLLGAYIATPAAVRELPPDLLAAS